MRNLLQQKYGDYHIEADPKKMFNGKYSVSVIISRGFGSEKRTVKFLAEDKIWYILEVEAAKESINLGISMIKRNLVGF